jgi:hypothetical protein
MRCGAMQFAGHMIGLASSMTRCGSPGLERRAFILMP